MSQTTSVQHTDYANIDTREWNMDIIKGLFSTKKNDQAHRPDEEEVQQKDQKKVNANEGPEKDEKESESNCITDEETGEGSKENSDCGQDGDVSFHEDKDEEIDKGEI